MLFTLMSLSKDRQYINYKVVDKKVWWNPFSWPYTPLFYGQMPVDDFLNVLVMKGTYVVEK